MTEKVRLRCGRLANPECTECSGEGFISISWNNNPDRCEDVACGCVWRAMLEEDGPDDDPDAWSGGFAENH